MFWCSGGVLGYIARVQYAWIHSTVLGDNLKQSSIRLPGLVRTNHHDARIFVPSCISCFLPAYFHTCVFQPVQALTGCIKPSQPEPLS